MLPSGETSFCFSVWLSFSLSLSRPLSLSLSLSLSRSLSLSLQAPNGRTPLTSEGNVFNGWKGFLTKHGFSLGQNLAVTVLCVQNSLDRESPYFDNLLL